MAIDVARHSSPDELARFRQTRRRGQWGSAVARPGSALPDGIVAHKAVVGEDGVVYVTKPSHVFAKREAREVRDALTDRRLAGILARSKTDPAFMSQLAHVYREKYPDLGSHMTDQEIVTVALEQAHRLATERTFKKLGRGVHQ